MFSYLVDNNGEIIAEHIGQPVDGWHHTEERVDATKFLLIDGVKVAKPEKIVRRFAQINQHNKVVNVFDWAETEAPSGEPWVYVDITGQLPAPQIGWDYEGGFVREHLPSLDEIKAAKLNELYTQYTNAKFAIIWCNGRGYDADTGSRGDFAEIKDLVKDDRDEWLALPEDTRGEEPTRPYRVWINGGTEKAILPHKFSDFVAAARAGADVNMQAFLKFTSLREAVAAAQTPADVRAVNW